MVVIIAGSREIEDYEQVCVAVEASGWAQLITKVVSGRARGVDLLGERWAEEHGLPVEKFPVTDQDWRTLGKRAGCLRNRDMAQYAAQFVGSGLILVWDGISDGSANMLKEAKLAGLKIYAPGAVESPTRRPFSLDEI